MAQAVEPLKLVPFNSTWINHDKIDIHAIYKRPRYKEDEFGERYREMDENGLPTWDLTGGLPVKQHNKWTAKGFEYVTLADTDSLMTAARFNTIENWKQYLQHQTGGPWNYKKYVAGVAVESSREVTQLEADVAKYGADIVEDIRKGQDPTFKMPDYLKGKPAGWTKDVAAAEPVKVAEKVKK